MSPELPKPSPASPAPALAARRGASLGDAAEPHFEPSAAAYLDALVRDAALASSGDLAACLVDLGDGRTWSYQGEVVRPAASIIKVPILLELYARHDAGDLDLDETVPLRAADKVGGAGVLTELHDGLNLSWRDLGRLMTVVSDNTASNMLIDRLSFEGVNACLARLGMDLSVLGRKFMIDPTALHAKNFTCVRDMARCLTSLYRGTALSASSTAEVLDILSRQQYREKIPLLLPEDLRVAHKTGEISGTRHDAAIVYASRPYVLVCMTWGLADVLAGDRAIAAFSRRIFDYIEDGASPRAT